MANLVNLEAVGKSYGTTTVLDGVSLGSVEEVQSDEELDIFHGISVRVGIGRLPREVSSDLVSSIEEGTVTVAILSDEIGSLPSSN